MLMAELKWNKKLNLLNHLKLINMYTTIGGMETGIG